VQAALPAAGLQVALRAELDGQPAPVHILQGIDARAGRPDQHLSGVEVRGSVAGLVQAQRIDAQGGEEGVGLIGAQRIVQAVIAHVDEAHRRAQSIRNGAGEIDVQPDELAVPGIHGERREAGVDANPQLAVGQHRLLRRRADERHPYPAQDRASEEQDARQGQRRQADRLPARQGRASPGAHGRAISRPWA